MTTKTAVNHTPTPWKCADDLITNDNGKLHIAKINEWASHANAAHIVHCVNLHDELVEALRAFNDAYSFISENCPHPLTHAVRKARRALARANEGGA